MSILSKITGLFRLGAPGRRAGRGRARLEARSPRSRSQRHHRPVNRPGAERPARRTTGAGAKDPIGPGDPRRLTPLRRSRPRHATVETRRHDAAPPTMRGRHGRPSTARVPPSGGTAIGIRNRAGGRRAAGRAGRRHRRPRRAAPPGRRRRSLADLVLRTGRPSSVNGGTTTTSKPSRAPSSASASGVPRRSKPNAASGVIRKPLERARARIRSMKAS